MELIFETFKDLMTLSKIKFLNSALYISIDIRRMLFLKNIIFKEADFRKFSHLKISGYTEESILLVMLTLVHVLPLTTSYVLILLYDNKETFTLQMAFIYGLI